MLLGTVRTREHMMPTRTTAAFTDGADDLAMCVGRLGAKTLQVGICVVMEYLLKYLHDENTPCIMVRTSSSECVFARVVTCR